MSNDRKPMMRAANFSQTAMDAMGATTRAMAANHELQVAGAALAGTVPPPPDLNAAIRAARQGEDEHYTIPAPAVRLAANGVPEPADLNAAIRAASKIEDFKARVRALLGGGR